MYRKSSTNSITLILFILAGIVIGGLIGDALGSIKFLSWLSYSKEFGLTEPISLDLGVIKVQFGLLIRFSISGIMGIAAAIFIHRKI